MATAMGNHSDWRGILTNKTRESTGRLGNQLRRDSINNTITYGSIIITRHHIINIETLHSHLAIRNRGLSLKLTPLHQIQKGELSEEHLTDENSLLDSVVCDVCECTCVYNVCVFSPV